MMNPTIIQWNLQSYHSKFTDLKILLSRYSPLCVCLQETLVKRLNFQPPSGYNVRHLPQDPTNGHSRGVAILIHRMLNYEEINLQTELQAVAIRIHLDKTYTVCSLYLPHDVVSKQSLENLLNQLPKPFLLLGDMNAHNQLWGSTNDNPRGRIIETIIASRDISILNDGSPTHFHVQNGTQSVIDLSICTTSILQNFKYSVLPDLYGSDHHPISIELISRNISLDCAIRYKTDKANWKLFYDRTEMQPFTEDGMESADVWLQQIEDKLMDAASTCIPLTSGKRAKPSKPWWNRECKDAVIERKRALDCLKRTHSIGNLIRYQRAKAQCRFICNQRRKVSWQQYISSITTKTPMKAVWKKVNKLNNKYSQSTIISLNHNNRIISNPQEVSEILAQSFSDVSSEDSYSLEFRRYKANQEKHRLNFACNRQFSYNEPLTDMEYQHSLSQAKESSPGIDKITYSMIKSAHPTLQTNLLLLYNRIFNENSFPNRWRISIIIPIPKPDKDSKDPTNYRPISLTSCLCKLLEKIINIRLMWFLENNNLIAKQQSGFRKNRSTTDQLVKLSNDLQIAVENKEHSIIVFFDVSKAYDTAWRYGVLRNLHQYGLRGSLPIFIANFLRDRRIVVRVGSKMSSEHPVENGIPQGSVLSCTCFLVAMNHINDRIPHSVKSTLYVDDYAIYASGKSSDRVERRIQQGINAVEEWSRNTGLTMSISKTKALHICKVRRCSRLPPDLKLNNVAIGAKTEYKFLGVFFDEKLNWSYHIKQLRAKCVKRLDLLKLLAHTKWGSDRDIIIRLYIMLIKPKLEYGLEAFFPAKEYLTKSLDTIQNSALRIATGAFRSSPVLSLYALTGMKPPSYYKNVKLLNYYLRLLVNKSHPLHERAIELENTPQNQENQTMTRSNSFFNKIQAIKNEFNIDFNNIYTENPPDRPPWRLSNLSICKELKRVKKRDFTSEQMKMIYMDHQQSHSELQQVFTDGSKTDGGVAYAIISDNRTITHRIQNTASIFTAETLAIQRTLDELNGNILICTDSKSAIQAISCYQHRNPIIQQIQQDIQSSQQIKLCWVPSHIGVRENERADSSARDAIENLQITPVKIPRSDHQCAIKAAVFHKWRTKWNTATENKLHEIQPNLTKIMRRGTNVRWWEIILARLRVGHTRLTHKFLMERSEIPQCDGCGDVLSIKHLILHCPAYADERRRYFGRTPTLRNCLVDYSELNGKLFNFLSAIDIINNI